MCSRVQQLPIESVAAPTSAATRQRRLQFVDAVAEFLWSARRRIFCGRRAAASDNISARHGCHDDALDLLSAFSCLAALDRDRNNILQLLAYCYFSEFFANATTLIFLNAVSVSLIRVDFFQ